METEKYKQYNELRSKLISQEAIEYNRLKVVNEEVEEVLDLYRSKTGAPIISYEQLSHMEYNLWLNVSKGVRFKRILSETKNLLFYAEMDPSLTESGHASFSFQKHDCKEYCYILEGELIEVTENGKVYEKGDTVVYPPLYIHKPSAKIKSIYCVEFIKP